MNSPKSIAFLCHPYHRGGVTRWMADAAIAYSCQGVEVFFITLEPTAPFFSGLGRETMLELLAKEKSNIHIITSAVGYEFEFGTPDYCIFIYKKLLDRIPLGTPVILSDDKYIWAAAVSMHSSFPSIGVLHADEGHYYNIGAKYFDRVAALTCVSKRVYKKIIEKINKPDLSKVFIIPCGINLPPVNVDVHHSSILELVYVGRISNYQKRVGDLVKIAALLVKNKLQFHLNIIGDGGEEKTELQEKFKDSGLDEYVTFRGWLSQKEVATFLNNSDVLLLTSDFEGTPVSMMEALASGCGIVGTRVSGIEDYEYDAFAPACFMTFNVGDIENATAKIIKLASVPVANRKKAAREIAEANFSMQGCLQKYSEVIAAIPPHTYTKSSVNRSHVKVIQSRIIALARYLKVKASKK